MNYTDRKRSATESQIRLILKLTAQSEIRDLKNLENCPPVERYRKNLQDGFLDNQTAAKLIDGLIPWKQIYG